jgi:transposase
MACGDLTDQERERIASLLPSSQGRRGGEWRDHRPVINGILWVLRTGAQWEDLPARYGLHCTCHDRLQRREREGVWERVLQALQWDADQAGELHWAVVLVDGTIVRTHQHTAGARDTPARSDREASGEKGAVEASDEALGRSRGGFSTKRHLAFEGRGRPLAVRLTVGQRHESTQLAAVMEGIRVPRLQDRRRQRPDVMVLDNGYSYPTCRRLLRQRGIRHVIPERKDQKAQRQAKGQRGGRPARFDREIYRLRSWAERGGNRLKQFRRIVTLYEKRATNYLGFVHRACVMIWLRA